MAAGHESLAVRAEGDMIGPRTAGLKRSADQPARDGIEQPELEAGADILGRND
jgi:hypothetical protein